MITSHDNISRQIHVHETNSISKSTVEGCKTSPQCGHVQTTPSREFLVKGSQLNGTIGIEKHGFKTTLKDNNF